MKPALKAALLSGLVFPGCGHLYLKKYRRGLLILSVLLLAVGIIAQRILEIVALVRAQIEKDISNINNISSLVAQANSENSLLYEACSWLVLLLWVFAIVDAYRMGSQPVAKKP